MFLVFPCTCAVIVLGAFGILHFLQYFTELHAADKQIFPCVAEMTNIRESMPIALSILQRYTNYFAPDSLDLVWL